MTRGKGSTPEDNENERTSSRSQYEEQTCEVCAGTAATVCDDCMSRAVEDAYESGFRDGQAATVGG